jgi:hypothetical protein
MLLGKLVDLALSRQITVVAAFEQSLPRGGFPAAVRGVIPVADEMAHRIPAGVYGAPGSDLPTTQAGGGWCLVTGSSFAAAQVSGLAALAIERGRRPFVDALVRGGNGRIEPCATVLGPSAHCGVSGRSPSLADPDLGKCGGAGDSGASLGTSHRLYSDRK